MMNFDIYGYWLLLLALLPIWLFIFYRRKDLRRKILESSFVGVFIGPISEYWHLKDYWQPPFTFPNFFFTPEDMLLGVFLIGIGVSLYDFVFKKENISTEKQRKRHFWGMFALGLSFMLIFNTWLGINSVFVTVGGFLFFCCMDSVFSQRFIESISLFGDFECNSYYSNLRPCF